MPNLKWSELKSMQLGRYAEYYAKMEFASYGYEVYTSEVDDHGVDFVVKVPGAEKFYEVQVRVRDDFNVEMHIDTDDANSAQLKNGDFVRIIKKSE